MSDLIDDRVRLLAESNGWTVAQTRGYIDGVSSRRRGGAPSRHAQVGIDEYSLGFRAGFYERKDTEFKPALVHPEPGSRRAG